MGKVTDQNNSKTEPGLREQTPKDKGPFDRGLVRGRRGRAQRFSYAQSLEPDRFIYTRVREDAKERLLDINRTFGFVLFIGDSGLTRKLADDLGGKLGYTVFADHSDFTRQIDVLCDEEHLPFRLGSFDLVISLLSLHGVNQVPQVLAHMKALLKPDGLMVCATLGGQTLGALRSVFYEAEDMLYGRVSPRVSSMIRLDQATSLLQDSGFTMPVADRDVVHVNYRSLHTLYQDLRAMGETNILSSRAKTPVSRRFFALAKTIYQRDHSNARGKVLVEFELLWLTGWAAHVNQQKPLKPGSAKTSLADALGVFEIKL